MRIELFAIIGLCGSLELCLNRGMISDQLLINLELSNETSIWIQLCAQKSA